MANTAPIYSLTSDAEARAESAAWAQFSAAKDSAEFCNAWLAILCAQIERVSGALLVLGPDSRGGYTAAAVWPDASRDMQYLGPTAESTLKARRGVVTGVNGGATLAYDQPAYVGYPIEVAGTLRGAVVIDILPRAEHETQRVLRLIHWASVWLVDQFRQEMVTAHEQRLARLSLASDIVATALQDKQFGAAALAVANELATRLACERVSVGWERLGSVEVAAISHTATFDRRSNLVRLIGEAMDEVLDLDVTIVHPLADNDTVGGIAHAELAAFESGSSICSVPLVDDGQASGVLLLQRANGVPFDAPTVELCQTVGMLLGPILALEREKDRGVARHIVDVIGEGARALFGPRHPGAKLVALVAAVAIVFFSFVSSTYRVAAKTVIEGEVQRAAAAPFEGFVSESFVRAGDTVKHGQVLARLDDRNLRLERARWAAEAEQAQRKFRQAAAAADRSAMAVTSAQIDQAQAQLALVVDRLERATLVAPFDGIVVTGDLSQLLGTPVEQGKTLFEIAPLDAYRVILNVDERDIGEVRVGQRGELALSGIPYDRMPFAVKQVTPVSSTLDGRNFFRVEAQLERGAERLRPGMEGVGKIEAGEHKIIWIWTHTLVDWLRLWAWRWLP